MLVNRSEIMTYGNILKGLLERESHTATYDERINLQSHFVSVLITWK